MNRRAFGKVLFGMLGYFGLGVAAKAETSKPSKGFRVLKDGEEVGGGHPLVRLLSRPNQISAQEFLIHLTLDMEEHGVAMVWMVPSLMGLPYELYRLNPRHAVPQPAVPQFPNGYYRFHFYGDLHYYTCIPADCIISIRDTTIGDALTKQLAPKFGEGLVIVIDPAPEEV